RWKSAKIFRLYSVPVLKSFRRGNATTKDVSTSVASNMASLIIGAHILRFRCPGEWIQKFNVSKSYWRHHSSVRFQPPAHATNLFRKRMTPARSEFAVLGQSMILIPSATRD